MVEKVTVAVDGGPASAAALRWVIDRAQTVALQLEITSVVGNRAELPRESDAEYRGAYQKALDAAEQAVLSALPEQAVTTTLRRGSPHEVLVEVSRHTDMLVIGTNKTTPIVGIMHGTLPLKVAGRSECITVIVPVKWSPKAGPVVAGWADDETASAALDFAAREAVRRKETLTIVHTWSAAPAVIQDPAATAIAAELAESNRHMFANSSRRLREAHPTLTIAEDLKPGSAAVAIVRAAARASLVVLGTRGRGAVTGFFLGSVSHDVLQNMPSPVAVVPKNKPIEVYPEVVDEDLL